MSQFKKSPWTWLYWGKVIKLCLEIFSDNLCRIFNRAIEKKIYPNDPKIAKVIALYKKGANFDPGNYRPISLLSFFDKIFGKILCRQLTKFLEKYQVFYVYQFEFRKRHSTVQDLIEFTDDIKRLLDEKKNNFWVFFIDFTKAFDTMDHGILLSKLEYYCIRSHSNDFFRSYLTNRRQYTLVNGVKSKPQPITCDVPQGSVLGPLFFLLYINDRCSAIYENSVRIYAGDTSILVSHDDITILRNQSKECFLQSYNWCLCNKLMINQDKTKCVLFHMTNKPVPRDFCALNVGAIDIERVKEVTYLGVILDEKLNWHKQNENICKSLLQFFGLFNHIKSFVTKQNYCQTIIFCLYLFTN